MLEDPEELEIEDRRKFLGLFNPFHPSDSESIENERRRKFLKTSLAAVGLLVAFLFTRGFISSASGGVVIDQNEMQANDYVVNSASQNWRMIGGVHSATSLDFQAYVGGAYSDYFYSDVSGTIFGTKNNSLDYTDSNSVLGSALFAGNVKALGNASSFIGDVDIANSGINLSAHAVRHEYLGVDAITNLGAFTAKGLLTANAGLTGTGNLGTLSAGPGILGNPNSWGAVQTFGNNISLGGATLDVVSLASNNLLQYNGTNWVNVLPTSLGLVNSVNTFTGAVVVAAGTNISITNQSGTITISTTSTQSSSTTLTALGTATSTNTIYGSNTITFQGSYWNGSSAQSDSIVTGLTQLSTSPTYAYFVQIGGGSNVFQVDQSGNITAFSSLGGTYNIGGTPTLTSTLALNGQTLSGSSIFSGLPNFNLGLTLSAIADSSNAGKLFLSSTTANSLKYYDRQSTPVLHQIAVLDSGSIPNSALAGNLVSSITAGTNISTTNPSGVGAATVNVIGNPSFATSVTSPYYLFASAIADASASGKLFLSSTTANYLKYYDAQTTPVLHQIATLDSGSIPNSALAGALVSSLTTETAAGITLTATNPSGVGAGYYTPSVSIGGDLSGTTLSSLTVAKLQTYTLTLTSPSTNQVMVYNGTAWVNQGVPATAGVTSLNTLTGALTLTSPNSTLNIGTSTPDVTLDINLGHTNIFTIYQAVQVAKDSDALVAQISSPSSASTNDSPYFRWTGYGYDTSAHEVDWISFANVTSQAGASSFTLQSRIGTASYATRFALTDSGVITTGIWEASSIANTYLTGPLVSSLTATNGLSVTNPSGVGASSYSLVLNGTTLSLGSSGLSLNLGNANTWTAIQYFNSNAAQIVINAPSGQNAQLMYQFGGTETWDIYADSTNQNLHLFDKSLNLNILNVQKGTRQVTTVNNTLDDGNGNVIIAGSSLEMSYFNSLATAESDFYLDSNTGGTAAKAQKFYWARRPSAPDLTLVSSDGTNFYDWLSFTYSSKTAKIGANEFSGGALVVQTSNNTLDDSSGNATFKGNVTLDASTPILEFVDTSGNKNGYFNLNIASPNAFYFQFNGTEGLVINSNELLPNTDLLYNIGTSTLRFSDLFVQGASLIQATGQAISFKDTYSSAGASQLVSPTEYFYGTGYTNASGTLGLLNWQLYNNISGGNSTTPSTSVYSILAPVIEYSTTSITQGLFLGNQSSATSTYTLLSSPYQDLIGSYWNGSAAVNYGFRFLSSMDSTTPTAHFSLNLNNNGTLTELLKLSQAGDLFNYGKIYPGNSAIQTSRYLYDDGTESAFSAGLSIGAGKVLISSAGLFTTVGGITTAGNFGVPPNLQTNWLLNTEIDSTTANIFSFTTPATDGSYIVPIYVDLTAINGPGGESVNVQILYTPPEIGTQQTINLTNPALTSTGVFHTVYAMRASASTSVIVRVQGINTSATTKFSGFATCLRVD